MSVLIHSFPTRQLNTITKITSLRRWNAVGAVCVLVFVRKKIEKKGRVRSQGAYWRLRRSRYSDAASANSATTAIPLNSGTGMFDCCSCTLLPEPGVDDCPLVTLILPSGVDLYPGPEMLMVYWPGTR
jgi:hypothetical protein